MEWYRLITIGFAFIALGVWLYFYYHYREPAAFVPITWLINVILFSYFKFYVGPDLKYYSASVTWSSVVLIHGIILLIAAAYIFKDENTWISHH